MINEKLMEVLTAPPDAALAIVTQGLNEPHVINSWNSYVGPMSILWTQKVETICG